MLSFAEIVRRQFDLVSAQNVEAAVVGDSLRAGFEAESGAVYLAAVATVRGGGAGVEDLLGLAGGDSLYLFGLTRGESVSLLGFTRRESVCLRGLTREGILCRRRLARGGSLGFRGLTRGGSLCLRGLTHGDILCLLGLTHTDILRPLVRGALRENQYNANVRTGSAGPASPACGGVRMRIERMLDELETRQTRTLPEVEGVRRAEAIRRTREYLLDELELSDPEDLQPSHLFDLAAEWRPAEWGTDPQSMSDLLELEGELAKRLFEQDYDQIRPFLEWLPDLREAVLRSARLADAIRLILEAEGEGVTADANGDLTPFTTGLDRVVRLESCDLSEAELERWAVVEVEAGEDCTRLTLQCASRQAIGEAPVRTEPLPAALADLVRPRDTIEAELAPASGGWRILDLVAVRPGDFRTS